MIQCVVCHASIADDSIYCANCGARQPQRSVGNDDQPTVMGAQPASTPAADDRTEALPALNLPAAPAVTPPFVPPVAPHQAPEVPPSPYAPVGQNYGPPTAPYAPPSNAANPTGQSPYAPQPGYGPPAPPFNPYGSPAGQTPYPPQQSGYGPTPYSPQQPGYGPPAYPPQQPGYNPAAYPPQPNQARKRGGAGRWLIGLGVALLLVAGGFGIYSATRDQTSPTPLVGLNNSATNTPRPTRTPRPSQPTPTDEFFNEPTIGIPPTVVPALDGAAGGLVYVSSNTYELVAVPASGGSEQALAFADSDPFYIGEGKFAPDGMRAVTYQRKGNGAILTVLSGDGRGTLATTTLTSTVPYELLWSPDSSKVAFIVNDADYNDNSEQNLFVLDATTGELRQVTTSGSLDTSPLAWSRDSTRFVYALAQEATTTLHTINADGSDDQSLVDSFTFGAWWLPDGRIVYEDFCDAASFERGICLLDPASKNIETFQPLGDNSLSGVSPDGTWLMLENYADGSLTLLNRETKATEIVVPPTTTDDEIPLRLWSVWSPDSRYVTFRDSDTYTTYAYEIGSNQSPQPLTTETVIAWLP